MKQNGLYHITLPYCKLNVLCCDWRCCVRDVKSARIHIVCVLEIAKILTSFAYAINFESCIVLCTKMPTYSYNAPCHEWDEVYARLRVCVWAMWEKEERERERDGTGMIWILQTKHINRYTKVIISLFDLLLILEVHECDRAIHVKEPMLKHNEISRLEYSFLFMLSKTIPSPPPSLLLCPLQNFSSGICPSIHLSFRIHSNCLCLNLLLLTHSHIHLFASVDDLKVNTTSIRFWLIEMIATIVEAFILRVHI